MSEFDSIDVSGLFTGSDVENAEIRDFRPLPAGTYSAVVSKVELETTKKGDQQGVVTLTVTGEDRTVKVWDRFWVRHASSVEGVRIGNARRKEYLLAGGASPVGSTVKVRLKVVTTDQGEEQNAVKNVYPASHGEVD